MGHPLPGILGTPHAKLTRGRRLGYDLCNAYQGSHLELVRRFL